MTLEINGVQLRTIKDPAVEIKGYADALAAVDAAELALKAARRSHAAKLTIVQDLQDEYAALVQRARRGETIEQDAAYKVKIAIPVAVADAELSVEGISAAEIGLAAARKNLHIVLRKALTPFLAQLQEDAAEANRRLAVVKTEAWEKGQYADRLMYGISISPEDFTVERCKDVLGIRG